MRIPAKFKVGIARYAPGDRSDLDGFQLRTFGPGARQLDAARTSWLFDLNPWRTGDARDMWVCRRDGDIVGQQAEIPFELQVGDRRRPASWGIDLMVDDRYRLHGVGPALFATALEARPIFAAMNPSEQGAALMISAGCTDLGIVPVYLRPLELGAAARLARLPQRVGRLLGPAAPVLRAVDEMLVGGLALAGVRLEAVDRMDRRVDEVWERSRSHYPVLARRDLAAVGWQIDRRPDRDIMRRHYLTRGDRTLGYVVTRPAGTEQERTAVVVDYLAPPRWVAPLLVAAGLAARREGAVAMSVKTRNEPADRYLRAAGFLRRDRGADPPIRFMVGCDDDEVRDRVRRPGDWLVTSADCDLEYGVVPG